MVEEVRGNPWDQAFREQVREQLRKYVPDALRLSTLQVTYVCESERVRSIVLEEAAAICREHRVDFQAVPVLDAKVRVGPTRESMPEVWRPLYRLLNCYIEYERSAVERPNIREKLMPLVRVAQAGRPCAVIFICETQVAAERFQEEHQRLQRAHQVSFHLTTSTVNADEDLSENAGGDLTHQVLVPAGSCSR